MADETRNTREDGSSYFNRPSRLKTAFQYAGAMMGTISGDGPQYGWDQAGAAYDYVRAKAELKFNKA